MKEVIEIVENAKILFHQQLSQLLSRGGLSRPVYVRYLSFQYHLTMGVQRHFLSVAGHPSLAGRRHFRDFLYRFALEEEPHFDIARHDLESMGASPLPCPLDVSLWWAYFDRIVTIRPFVRLGATCVLENLGSGAGTLGHQLLNEAPFLNEKNTRFLQIHFHEVLPHGDQILEAINQANPAKAEMLDLIEGATRGGIMYLRMVDWALGLNEGIGASLLDLEQRLEIEEAPVVAVRA